MKFSHRKMQIFCQLSALLTVIAFAIIQTGNTPRAHAATNQFMGVNWADPNNNFGTGNLALVGTAFEPVDCTSQLIISTRLTISFLFFLGSFLSFRHSLKGVLVGTSSVKYNVNSVPLSRG